ncbi:MAG: M20/M25/M40 family metallo-hydrolase [Candidatus Aminicenantes bacterium]|nr:M20/M25/M40 family metallo-hydrolase [Candidatus Aminicenantes bacterium]
MKTTRAAFVPLLTAACLLAALAGPGSAQRQPRRAPDVVQSSEIYDTCKTLASAEFAGRLTGHQGYAAAAQWAAGRFKAWKMKPAFGRDNYLQGFPAPYTLVDEADMTLLFPGKADDGAETIEEVKLEAGRDFLPLLFTDSGRNEAEVVFAGWGISAPELGYDDYAGLEVKDRFVLCFRGTPDPADLRFEDHDQHRVRMKTARDKGALGVVYIYPEVSANPNGDRLPNFTPAEISEKTADLLFKEKDLTADQVKKSLFAYKRPLSMTLSARMRYGVVARHFPAGVGYNVVGWIEGRDPSLRNECVIFGAHLDHCGRHMGLLFPGADDNASGSATVMEIARAFARSGRKPRRSVVFVLFGGEEMGLLGSKHFADNLPSRFKTVAAMFNFDMTGAGDGAFCGVSAEPAAVKEAIEAANRQVNIVRGVRIIRRVGVRSSDFAPFFLKGIPVASFASNGPHLAYHQPGDTIYRINPDIMADIARVAFRAGLRLADL